MEVARQNVEGKPRNARLFAVPSGDLVTGDNLVQSHSVLAIRWPQSIQCDGDPHRPSRFECQLKPSIQSDAAESSKHSVKYGLRGIRVGEASHQGPGSRAKSRCSPSGF